MHEFSIAMNIVDIATDYARKENVSVVKEIEIEVGELAGVVMDALEKAKGNVGEAAEILGKHRNWIHELIRRHKLKKFVARLRYEAINSEP